MTRELKIQDVYKELARIDPNLTIGSEQFKAAVVLLSALSVGTDTAALSKFTGFPRATINKFGQKLQANGVWKNGKTNCQWFEPNGEGTIAFFMDVNVALGYVEKARVGQ